MHERRINHDPHQRLEYLDRMINGPVKNNHGQKTPVPMSKNILSPPNLMKEPSSTQKFEALKMKVDNVSDFNPLDLMAQFNTRKNAQDYNNFMNTRRSRQERSGSSSADR